MTHVSTTRILIGTLALILGSSAPAAIVLAGTHYNMETKDNDPTVGWRRSATPKTLDIDGDNVVGTDGYRTSNRGADPTYATATVVAPSKNIFSRIDDPDSTTADVQTETLHDGNAGAGVETRPLLQFVITGAIPAGKTLRVGVLFDGVGSANGTNSATYTLKQTVGGSATATTPALFYQDGGLDVTYFDLTSFSVGDTFVVTSTSSATNTEFSGAFEQVIGITFDTGVTGAPGKTFADWINGFTGLGALTAFDDDADGDGIKNGIEAFFGTAPNAPSAGLSAGGSSSNSLSFTHPEAKSPLTGLTGSYEWSLDHSTWNASGDDVGGTIVTFGAVKDTPESGTTTVTSTITGTGPSKVFVRAVVTQN
jgi:hypothetical protein